MPSAVRVGVVNDMADLGPGPGDLTDWLEREVERLHASGRIAASVEFVHAYGLGLPSGTAEAIETAFQELVEQDVVLIVGPAIGDNALVAAPLAERARVPTINWAGAERARSRYMFQLQVGSHEDESLVIARHLAESGARRLAVVYDSSPIGTRHLKYLEDEAAILDLELVARVEISPLANTADDQVARALGGEPDTFVYLGLGVSAPPVASALTRAGWTGTRIMNTAGLRGYHGDFAQVCDGWTYVDMHSDANRTLQALLKEQALPPHQALAAARGHDLGRLVAEGIARARDFSREGLRVGLEQVKWLPAAEGEEGTLLGFGIQDRGALHGRYLVLRQWLGGKSVEVAR
ncbi:ABC-type branched-subunit amino acid transport system substrate-binding protein [Novosphingobium chloroacetimidivorans]|uniref:ABC-type branched-subunit amino acid transport system substrate-binding protein n=1 Tax=Novosphingobium chloroacetimidivorans TaxID=1428314 RepID=A0A7W7K5Y5_9SPHN|nr:ABC transporter substrate-binding protein [Novosphingobium chloroacetimidivorans]MBB4856842.1 ABC-type branched-subunit amino acid transport system substrate-binding protein [Novosphingobium chloroacetimidivorans]